MYRYQSQIVYLVLSNAHFYHGLIAVSKAARNGANFKAREGNYKALEQLID